MCCYHMNTSRLTCSKSSATVYWDDVPFACISWILSRVNALRAQTFMHAINVNPNTFSHPTPQPPRTTTHHTIATLSQIARQNSSMAPTLYPRGTVKKIVKAHSNRQLSKNVDILVRFPFALCFLPRKKNHQKKRSLADSMCVR